MIVVCFLLGAAAVLGTLAVLLGVGWLVGATINRLEGKDFGANGSDATCGLFILIIFSFAVCGITAIGCALLGK